ncbi:unnamed protein product [Lepeophtheirus salmonis]|uniref:(salmon louse) hypothetical protein n=1 Tax=Lepeophtheirus salmonis TaxID=72036 RepID=A0A7R8H0T5_LEPSM|nr:unnamed protein product [Lepeophtheirus salmonis]CAF2795507.1 unnamed protein product [Lepeophtheirus salmonis]
MRSLWKSNNTYIRALYCELSSLFDISIKYNITVVRVQTKFQELVKANLINMVDTKANARRIPRYVKKDASITNIVRSLKRYKLLSTSSTLSKYFTLKDSRVDTNRDKLTPRIPINREGIRVKVREEGGSEINENDDTHEIHNNNSNSSTVGEANELTSRAGSGLHAVVCKKYLRISKWNSEFCNISH